MPLGTAAATFSLQTSCLQLFVISSISRSHESCGGHPRGLAMLVQDGLALLFNLFVALSLRTDGPDSRGQKLKRPVARPSWEFLDGLRLLSRLMTSAFSPCFLSRWPSVLQSEFGGNSEDMSVAHHAKASLAPMSVRSLMFLLLQVFTPCWVSILPNAMPLGSRCWLAVGQDDASRIV